MLDSPVPESFSQNSGEYSMSQLGLYLQYSTRYCSGSFSTVYVCPFKVNLGTTAAPPPPNMFLTTTATWGTSTTWRPPPPGLLSMFETPQNIDSCNSSPCGLNTSCKLKHVGGDRLPSCQCLPGHHGDPYLECTAIRQELTEPQVELRSIFPHTWLFSLEHLGEDQLLAR